MQIASGVRRRIEFDLDPIRAELRRRLAEPSDEYIWVRADRIAADAIRQCWSGELEEQCARALGDVHDEFLVSAARCLEAGEVLEAEGHRAWLAKGVIHQLAFDAVWDVIGDGDLADEAFEVRAE